MSGEVPEVKVQTARRSLLQRISVVWLVPIAALVIALGIAWQTYNERGPLISIVFEDGAGVIANETELRFRDVVVGVVEKVGFTKNLENVLVEVRIDKDVAPYVDSDAEFWVVRPEVTTEGVTGLDTVLSGVYIRGRWDTEPKGGRGVFSGLSRAPLVDSDQEGLRIVLRASDGVVSGESPILYKGVEVGRIGHAQVSQDGFYVEAEAVIFAPYDNLVTETTRFWDTSGFSVSIGTGGAEIDFDSVAALLAGGLAFDTFVSGAVLAEDGQVFEVYGSEDVARNSVFNTPDGPALNLVAVFDGNVSGLAVGAAVELEGVRIGSVSGLNGLVDPARFGDRGVRLQTVLNVLPARLGMPDDGGAEQALEYFQSEVADGLRARLVTGSILTGGLKVQLIKVENASPETLDPAGLPYPALPVTASEITNVQATAQGTLDRINALPIEELLGSATSFLNNASLLVGSEDLQATPGDVRELLGDIRAIVGSDDVQSVPGQIGSVMTELEAAVGDVRLILDEVREQEAVTRMLATVDAAGQVADTLDASLAGVPALIERIDAVAATAQELPVETLLDQVSGLAEEARALIGSDTARALPGQIGSLAGELELGVSEARTLLSDVNEGGGGDSLVAAINSAARAADSLDKSLVGVPQLVARIDAFAAKAEDLPLDVLVAEVSSLVNTADRFLAQDTTRQLPEELNGALDELRQILAQMREGGVVENANATFASAANAADRIAIAADSLPALLSRAEALLVSANGTVGVIGDATDPALRDLRAALRDVSEAADAIGSLARSIERRPNSLLTGR